MEQSQSVAVMPAEQSMVRNVDVIDREAGGHNGLKPASRPLVLEGKGYWHRASSYILDAISLGVFAAVAGISATIHLKIVEAFVGHPLYVAGDTEGSTLLLSLALNITYFAVFEGLFGATPGKVVSKLRVVMVDGRPCTFTAAVSRSFSRLVDGLLFGVIAALNMHQPLNQRWGDKLAHTQVVSSGNPGIRQHRSWLRFGLAIIAVWVMQTMFVIANFLLLP